MQNGTEETVTGAAAILSALEDAGITHLFVNLGSDHPAFLAAFASREHTKLQIFSSPNEMNALSAASGFAQVTGRPAAVLVHVECGTQGLAGAVHNVSKGRIPVMIFAGTVPFTQEGELKGSRNEYIHWIQDVPDQRAILRQYMRFEHEIRTPFNARQTVLRALQFATSSPQGPTYLIAAREVLKAEVPVRYGKPLKPKASQSVPKNGSLELCSLSHSAREELASVLLEASRPLIVTSYSGRSEAGFEALRQLAELLVIPVHENAPIYNNFPTTSFLHQGHQWNGGGQLPALAEADVIIVVDSDVPWIPAQSKPNDEALIYHLDCDPLKEGTTLWSLPCEKRWKCDSSLALQQLVETIRSKTAILASSKTRDRIESRTTVLQTRFEERQARLTKAESSLSPTGGLTVPYFMAALREACDGLQVVGLNESTTNLGNVADHLRHTAPLSLIGSGGGALGWYSGAAVGAHMGLRSLGRENDMLIAFTGDGTWLFGIPSCAYWMAKKYETPFLTIIWNNGGWSSPKNACLRIHSELNSPVQNGDNASSKTRAGVSDLAERLMVGIDPSPAFGKIAEGAGNAWWAVAAGPERIDEICREAIRVVREEKRCAVVEVVIDKI
ncbi:hypothetical protein H2200_003634 [Cladophialophora chaetospira]|uniref:Pyruvate decarboxylase n=1 Tax=Cladophialophora chaetospira TaxID=386627 RepID=A0AA38XFD2_9EURO|nr:hypothetical protein H2200_003634 [Cladophialophora chaetospira]